MRAFDRRNRQKRNAAQRRRYWKKPGLRERRCLQKKRWRERNLAKVKLQKRAGRLAGTWGYRSREAFLEAMRKQNQKRADHHREWARNNQQVYYKHGKKLYPHCAKCGGVIAWDRRGRPKKYHSKCNPWQNRNAA
jgi:hypothetical protein